MASTARKTAPSVSPAAAANRVIDERSFSASTEPKISSAVRPSVSATI
ncbi:MAG TPA: hypothetical protein VGD91_30105 [Trebonia sp.]